MVIEGDDRLPSHTSYSHEHNHVNACSVSNGKQGQLLEQTPRAACSTALHSKAEQQIVAAGIYLQKQAQAASRKTRERHS